MSAVIRIDKEGFLRKKDLSHLFLKTMGKKKLSVHQKQSKLKELSQPPGCTTWLVLPVSIALVSRPAFPVIALLIIFVALLYWS